MQPMSLSFLRNGQNRGAGLLSRAGRPRPAFSVCNTIEEADEDVGRGRGRPSHKTKLCNRDAFPGLKFRHGEESVSDLDFIAVHS